MSNLQLENFLITTKTEATDVPWAVWAPSNNYGVRPEGTVIDTVVMHFTCLPLTETLELLSREGHQASTHYVICREGRLYQMVAEEDRAWHAGVSRLGDRDNVNDFSIGVDLVFHPDKDPGYTEAQYESLKRLLENITQRHTIHELTGHEDVALPPGRKTDPGPLFDWERVRSWFNDSSLS